MVEREMAVMAILVLMMAFLLAILIVTPSRTFVTTVEAGFGWIRAVILPSATVTTIPVQTTFSFTSSSSSTTTTSIRRYQPSSTSLPTTSRSQTTTTLVPSQIRCSTDDDCGGTFVTIGCKANTIWNLTTVHTCSNRGSESSYCLEKKKEKPLIACEDYERCKSGVCMLIYDNECDMLCQDANYDHYYCTDLACSKDDEKMPLKRDCAKWGRFCCCRNDENKASNLTLQPN